jgi:hypothetical protein
VIFDLSFGDEISFPPSMVMLKDYNSLGMGLRILLRQIDFASFLMLAVRRIILAVFVPAATSLTMVICTISSPTTSIRLVGCYSLAY